MKKIYGLFDASGRCAYVGCSVQPRDRFYVMRSRHGVFREVWRNYATIERRGQCWLNRESHGKTSRRFFSEV